MNSFPLRVLRLFVLVALATGLPSSLVCGEPTALTGGSITISGVVKRPGTYQIAGALTIMEALKLAGGISDATYNGENGPPASMASKTCVVRGNQTFVVNLGHMRTKNDENFEVLPGDKIAVPEIVF